MKIKDGYKVLVEDPDGNIFQVIDISEYDLEKSVARGDVMNEIKEAIDVNEAKACSNR